MGNQLAGSGSSVTDLSGLLLEVPSFVHGQTLGLGKILKTAWCEHDEGRVIVKLYPKRAGSGGGGGGGGGGGLSSGGGGGGGGGLSGSSSSANINSGAGGLGSSSAGGSSGGSSSSSTSSSTVDPEFRVYERRLEEHRERFNVLTAPNVLPFARWIDGERAVFLFRQYFAYNVADRFHTHPFLTALEKRWFAYQVLEGLRQLHSGNVRHGDLKTENLLCTSWNWLLLTDLSFYKPTYLPADNPADYSFYFETTRRRCYLAPERFYSAGEREKTLQAAYAQSQQLHPSHSLSSSASTGNLHHAAITPAASNFDPATVTEAMDVFSAGCCIAEIFMEGEPLFDLSQLLSYREGVFDVASVLQAKIADADIRDLVQHMIQLSPSQRFSAKGYLREWTPRSFPSSFSYLHKLFTRLMQPDQLSTPDQKLHFIKGLERTIIREVAGVEPAGKQKADRERERERESQRDRERQKEREREQERQREQQRLHEEERKARHPLSALTTASSQGKEAEERKEKKGADSSNGSIAISVQHPSTSSPSSPSGLGASLAAAAFSRSPASAPYAALLTDLSTFASQLEGQSAEAPLKDWTAMEPQAKAYKRPHFKSALPVDPPDLRIQTPTNSFTPSTSSYSPSNSPTSTSSISAHRQHYSPESPTRRSPAPGSSVPRQSLTHSTSEDIRLDDSTSRSGGVGGGSGSGGGGGGGGGGSETAPVVTAASNVLTMIVTLVCSCVQNVTSPKMKLVGLELLQHFGQYVEDEVRLGRMVPYCVALLSDGAPSVRAMAVHTLTRLVELVHSFQQADAHIFPEYIFPALSRFPADAEELVRLSYAQNLAQLADTSKRFLDIARTLQETHNHAEQPSKGSLTPSPSLDALAQLAPSPPPPASLSSSVQSSYDEEVSALQKLVTDLVIQLWTEGGSKVKRSLLVDMTRLCAFIGRKKVNIDLLGHLINILNDPDWQLRVSFFDHIVGVSVFVGRIAFQKIVLPCVEPALFDVEEAVIQRAVHALSCLVSEDLFDKRVMMEIVHMAGPLLCHPSAWIRNESIGFVLSIAQALGLAKAHCFLLPALRPFLKEPVAHFSRPTLVPALKPPLTRAEFNSVVFPHQRGHAHHNSASSAAGAAASQSSAPSSSLPDAFLSAGTSFLPTDGGDGSSLDGHGGHSHSGDEDGDRLRTVSSSSNASNHLLSTSAASASSSALSADGGSAASGWQSDPLLQPAMQRYLTRVANAVARKSYASPVDGHVSAGEAEDDLSSYAAIDDEAPVYQVVVERTFQDPTAGSPSSTVDRVQQDLLDSLGMQVQRQQGATASAIRAEQARQASDVLQQKAHPSAPPSRHHREPIRQPLSKVPHYIQRALKIPSAPPSLGVLREGTVSTSAFYRNHHALEAGHGEGHSTDPRQWRPRGVLVATLTEHSRSVNALAVSRDNVFLVSGSDDGSVKVWDCASLKFKANARSQLTHQQPGRVTAVTTCDSSHSIVSASDAGLVQVMKVESVNATDDAGHKYGGWSEVRRIDARHEGAVLCVEHFNTISESLLLYGTQRGAVHSWDLRSKREPFTLHLEPAMGLLSALVIGPTPYCLIAGTSRGYICVWDLRFQLLIQVWRHHAKSRILSLTPHDSPSILAKDSHGRYQHPAKGPLVFVAAEGVHQLAAFDLLTGECRMVMRVQAPTAHSTAGALRQASSAAAGSSGSAAATAASAAAAVSANADGQLRHKVSVSPLSLPSLRSYLKSDYPQSLMDDSVIKELQNLTDAFNGPHGAGSTSTPSSSSPSSLLSLQSSASITSFLCCPQSFALTAGSDRILRFWDLHEPIDSYRVSQPDMPDDVVARYTGRIENSTCVMEEVLTHAQGGAAGTGADEEPKAGQGGGGARGGVEAEERMRSALAKKSRGQSPPSSCHQSEIVDLKAIEFPQKMLASASTDGIIKIWI